MPFVIADTRTAGQYFGCQGTRQKRSDNIVSSVSINGSPYNGPFYGYKVNCFTLLLGQILIIMFVEVVLHSKKQSSRSISMIASLESVIAYTNHHSKSTYFRHPSLSEEEIKSGCRLGLDCWADNGCSGKHAYVD